MLDRLKHWYRRPRRYRVLFQIGTKEKSYGPAYYDKEYVLNTPFPRRAWYKTRYYVEPYAQFIEIKDR